MKRLLVLIVAIIFHTFGYAGIAIYDNLTLRKELNDLLYFINSDGRIVETYITCINIGKNLNIDKIVYTYETNVKNNFYSPYFLSKNDALNYSFREGNVKNDIIYNNTSYVDVGCGNSKLQIGDTLYFIKYSKVQRCLIESIQCKKINNVVRYLYKLSEHSADGVYFCSVDDLMKYMSGGTSPKYTTLSVSNIEKEFFSVGGESTYEYNESCSNGNWLKSFEKIPNESKIKKGNPENPYGNGDAVDLVKPSNTSNCNNPIVLTVVVNSAGVVTSIQSVETALTEQACINAAKEAAKKTTFQPDERATRYAKISYEYTTSKK